VAENTFTIRGARIIDGSGAPAVRADVIVVEGVIAEIGKLIKGNERGKIIDASGLTLTPGFIDMHAHSDLAVISDREHLSKVTQGVTLEVVGQDGLSYVPSDDSTLAVLRDQLYGWNGDPVGIDWKFRSVKDYLALVDQGAAVNVAYLIPHGNVRMLACGNEPGDASPEQMRHQLAIVEESMQQGAVGMSAGLTYTPAMYASDLEIAKLCEVVGKFGGYYAPHHRNYGAGFLDAVDACIDISRISRCALHLTHCHMSHDKFHDKSDELFERFDKAESQGIDISLDSYPYLAGSTYLHALLPSWCQAGTKTDLHRRINEPQDRLKIINNLNVSGSDGNQGGIVNWPCIVIAGVTKPHNLEYVGEKLVDCAIKDGKSPVDFYLDLIADEDFKVSCILFSGYEPNVRAIMKHKHHMVGTDGILTGNRPHPRGYGTFARYLGVYAREEGILSMEGAIARMTGRPAGRLQLTDRGLLKVGYVADLTLFDSETVKDRATYEEPRLVAQGFESVWIGGIATLKDGKRTSNIPGHAIRSKALPTR
jgi:N-acyl-D-amino-acid deacylase